MNYGYDENGNPVVYASQVNQNNNMYNGNQNYNGVKKTNSLCIVGFVLTFFTGLVGFILSIVGLCQAKKNNEGGIGLAIAGIIIGAIRIAFIILIFVIMILAVATEESYYEDYETSYRDPCSNAACDYYCEEGSRCKCYYYDSYGNKNTTYCYVDWDINSKDYSSLA